MGKDKNMDKESNTLSKNTSLKDTSHKVKEPVMGYS